MRGRAVLLVAAVLAGCAGDDGVSVPSAPPASAPTPSATPSAAPTPSPAPTPEPPPSPVTLAFAGDIHFEGALRARLDDPATALAPIAAQLGAADLTVVNLESSVGTSGTPEPGKRFTFQAPPSALTALGAAGVDVVSMANNHAMDFGPDGLADTLAAAAAAAAVRTGGVDVVGVGADITAAFAPAVRDVRGTTVAVIGANVPDDPGADPTAHWAATGTTAGVATALDPAPLLAAVAQARASADVVVVYLHWGVQGESCPSPSQTALATALADPGAGADVVVGSHTHRLQGAGLAPSSDAYVAYGLGNFVWYTQGSEATSTTGVLTLTVDGGAVTAESWAPARIGADGLPAFATGDAATAMTAGRAALRDCTDLRPLP
jgi:poly-gamma-glutamate synthesis protein (capsule biosynthesis protein)